MDFSGWHSDMESTLLDRPDNDNSWDETMNEWTELTTFPAGGGSDEAGGVAGAKEGEQGSEPSAAGGSGIAENESISILSSTTGGGVASVTESSDRSVGPKQSLTAELITRGLHPQAIQSSAMCPPYSKILPPYPNSEHVYPAPSQQENLAANFYGANLGRVAAAAANSGLPAPSAPTMQNVLQGANSNFARFQQQNVSTLADNYLLARNTNTANASNCGLPAPSPPTSQKRKSTRARQQSSTQKQYVTSSVNSGSSSGNSSQTKKAPPFLLFDSPVELRISFNQNQRRLGMPVKHDCNSYHYGEAVNGFHPQHLGTTTKDGSRQGFESSNIQLIDGRHAPQATTGRIKNEREQKRAQKITELIDQLGDIMKDGGWNVSAKSKYQTLSSCTEYMKHLIKTKGEKEEAVKNLKKELEQKTERMEEDKTAQEGRSDLESVTSSLTTSTGGSSRLNPKLSGLHSNKRKARFEAATTRHHKKHQASHNNNNNNMSSISANDESSGESRTNGGRNKDHTFSIDKTVLSVSDLTDSNRGSSSNNSGSGGSGSGTRTGSGGSGSGSKGSGSTEREPVLGEPHSQEAVPEDQQTTSSISSDAAVVSEKSSRDHHNESPQHNHKDVVFASRKREDSMRPPEAVTSSSEASYKLNYEEVFDQSNIPQLIAGTSGKIVSWNQSFVNATGLEESDLERMTIFSLVQPDKLSNFFEIAAIALRSNDDEAELVNEGTEKDQSAQSDGTPATESSTSKDESSTSQISKDSSSDGTPATESATSSQGEENQRKWNYAAMTLPCVEFPAMKERRESSSKWDKTIEKLNMTMILISDPDPRKRCFHCTFTDSPAANGTLGIVTPDLLAALYSNPEKLNLEQHPRYRRKHKRAKIQAEKAATSKNQTTALQLSLALAQIPSSNST
ncbi:MAG: hypothetical protein SGBAC_003121 [Bacillariaceae sp.]